MTPNRDLIFDIGMHIGQDTEFYLKKGFNVIAVEANPVLVEAAQKRFSSEIAAGRLKIENVCIGTDEGRADFFVNNEFTEWSSVSEQLGSRQYGSTKITVDMVRYLDLAEKYGTPYYLKIDIEGMDIAPILDLYHCPKKPAFVSCEASGIEGAAHLFAIGYKKFKYVLQHKLPNYILPAVALEGKYAAHVFPFGSSGPFGNETPGPWSQLEEALTDYFVHKHFGLVDKRFPPGWADFHACSDRFKADFT
jgi:FkbM family methyltransferase